MNIVLCAPVDSFAVTQFDGFYASSFFSFGGKLFFTNDDGLYSYDEESTDEVVSAFFELPFSDHGYVGEKKIRSILIDGRVDGALFIESYVSDLNKEEYTTEDMSGESGTKVAGMSRQIGHYFGFRISNIDGSYFSIDKITLVTILMAERRM